jgi:hypothetical protein
MDPELQAFVEKYGVMINTPSIEGKENAEVFLVRHGLS